MRGSIGRAGGAAPLVFWDLVEESLDEADFLWQRREAALDAWDQTSAQVETAIEDRLRGAVEGLCVPGAGAVERVLAPALASDEPSTVAVAAHALLAAGTLAGAAQFTTAFLRASGDRLVAMRRGLELVGESTYFAALAGSIADAPEAVHAAFLEACAFRALAPQVELGHLSSRASPALQRAAARLWRHAPHAVRQVWTARSFELEDGRAREIAVETGLVVGARGAWELCRELASADLHGSAAMLLPVAMIGSAKDHDIVLAALGDPRRRREALWALGFGGRRAGADACVDLLAQGHADARLVALAGEAFCAITGLDLRASRLEVAPPPRDDDDVPSFEDDDLDGDLVPAVEDRLPVPDVPGVIRWWNQHRARFASDTRYLAGRPVDVASLLAALADGSMRRRHATAFELAVRTRGGLDLQTRDFVTEQRRRLGEFSARPMGGNAAATSSAVSSAVSLARPSAGETSRRDRR
jgi:uncharacterized protein (TIGR02270 family)